MGVTLLKSIFFRIRLVRITGMRRRTPNEVEAWRLELWGGGTRLGPGVVRRLMHKNRMNCREYGVSFFSGKFWKRGYVLGTTENSRSWRGLYQLSCWITGWLITLSNLGTRLRGSLLVESPTKEERSATKTLEGRAKNNNDKPLLIPLHN